MRAFYHEYTSRMSNGSPHPKFWLSLLEFSVCLKNECTTLLLSVSNGRGHIYIHCLGLYRLRFLKANARVLWVVTP